MNGRNTFTVDTRPGSGYQILRRWRVRGADGREQEVVILARTLLPVQPGTLPKRYLVACGSPFARWYGLQGRDGFVGEYDVYGEAERAAEDCMRETQEQQGSREVREDPRS